MATLPKNDYSFMKWGFAVGALYFWADEIWTMVSLQTWIYIFSGIAVFYLFAYLVKQRHKKG
jgi:hypothetical protein